LPPAIAAVVLANIESVLGHSGAWAVGKLVVALVLLAEGLLLTTDWRRARRDATAHVLTRFGRGRFWRWLLGPVLLVAGVLCLAFGGLEVVRAAQDGF
jgi:hypothetical protein